MVIFFLNVIPSSEEKLLEYKLALQLHKVFNTNVATSDWTNINLNNIQTSRQTGFMTSRNNRLKLGMNIISNRFFYPNGKIELGWLKLAYRSFKTKLKNFSFK